MENKIEPLSPECLNCIHYWNISSVIPRTISRCTNSESPNYGKEVKTSDVCDFFILL
jgi:hypothetical protein